MNLVIIELNNRHISNGNEIDASSLEEKSITNFEEHEGVCTQNGKYKNKVTEMKEGVKNSDQETIFHKSEKRTEFFDMLKNENNNSTNISNHNSKTNKNNEQRDLRFLN
ncbi:hypothetical protein POCGH01_00234600 [Plasmodium ovale]|uniref:Uncharacterized protein n=1 Tax=Plasmodium ovale TaxID=36330 RepID=A0A1D3JFX1_PLAOA|nr:hypothetical protein POCGH01_00234600 [Plasmodium ovale]